MEVKQKTGKSEIADTDIFKKPLSILSRPKIILTEEEYVKEIERIIQRDFFSDLTKLKAQKSYLEALETNDVSKLRELYGKYSILRSRQSSDTPLLSVIENTPYSSEDKDAENNNNTKDRHLTLNQFLQTHTSEDNSSFEEIVKEMQERHKIKHSWMFAAEKDHNEGRSDILALPSLKEQCALPKLKHSVDTWNYCVYNPVMFVPDGVPLNDREKMENIANHCQINHGQTHFIKNPFNERLNQATISEAAQNQARSLEGKVGIDGKELKVGNTPVTNSWSLLRTPSPNPGVDASPFMTWGEIEGTPFRLDASDMPIPSSPGPSFKIPELSKRDQMALKLADKVSQQHKEKKDRAIEATKSIINSPANMHNSKSVLKRLGSMSPAAQQLATSRLGVNLGTRFSSCDRMSPSPRMGLHTAVQSPRPIVIKKQNMTAQKTPKRINDSLTDDLLQLPKRQRAADYFQ